MKTPREILLQQHQAASRKLDAIRAEVVKGIAPPPGAEIVSWRERIFSLRWHLGAMSAAWAIVLLLSMDHSPGARAMVPRGKSSEPRQIWASLRESRRLLLQLTDAPAVEAPALPGRRSEIESRQVEV